MLSKIQELINQDHFYLKNVPSLYQLELKIICLGTKFVYT